MRIAPLLLVVVIGGVSLGSGCGTLSIGRAPTDIDLVNDGSPESQAALQKKYAVTYRDGWIERPGATPEVVESEINVEVEAVRTGAWADEAADYLGSSELAFDATDTALVGFDRFAQSGTPVLILEAGGVLIGTAVGATLAIVNAADNVDAVVGISDISNAAFTGAFTGLLLSLPLVIVYDWTVPPLSTALSASDYRKGVRAFNKDLEQRIQKQASRTKAAPPSPPPSTRPPPPTAPAPPSDPAPTSEPTPPSDPAPTIAPIAPPAPSAG